MFDQLVESTAERKNAKILTFFLVNSVLGLTALIAAIVIGIMMWDAQLNYEFEKLALVAMAPPAAPPPPPPAPVQQVKQAPPEPGFVAQTKQATEIKPPPPHAAVQTQGVPGGVPGGVEGGDPGGVPGGAPGGVPGGVPGGIAPPPPPPDVEPPPKPAPPSVQRVSGGVLAGKAIARPQPPYPQMARAAGIEGAVVVEVTVGENGSVISARAVSGHPLLRDAAVQAARGWRFSPTMLSGVPVKVIGTITFNFRKS